MISERKFSSKYTSFWNQAMPLAESFMRKINLQLERFEAPIYSETESNRRGLINELAFRHFKLLIEQDVDIDSKIPTEITEELISKTTHYLQRLSGTQIKKIPKPNKEELNEVIIITKRILKFFLSKESNNIVVSPSFLGCGILQSCKGDVIKGSTLYELKAGDREFRLVDLRQLTIYCTLNYASKSYSLNKAGLFNPRRGVFCEFDLETLAIEAAGKTFSELFGDIIDFVSTELSSR